MHSRLTRPLGVVLVAVALGVGAIGVLVVTGGDDPAPPTDSDTERASDDAMPTETRARTRAQDPLQFPNRATTGVPGDWRPAVTRGKDLTVTEPNQTIEDIRFTKSANLLLGGDADNVTVRRVEFEGGFIKNNIDLADESNDAVCGTNLLIEDTTFEPEAGQPFTDDFSAVADGGYTARRLEMVNRGEGFRLGGCGPVTIEDSFVHIVGGITGDCDNPFPDPHSDGIQGFGGKGLTATNNTITFGEQCGTGPYSVGWGSANPANPPDNVGDYSIDRLLVAGGSYSFQHMTEDANIRGLRIVKDSWAFGPLYTACSKIDDWEAKLVTLNHSHRDADGDFKIASEVADLPCNVDDYG